MLYNIKFNQKMKMMNFAVIAVIMSVMIMGTNQAKIKRDECCTTISFTEITAPITGFRLQQPKPPCVKAVVFYTAEHAWCSHWKQNWVKQKVQELRKLQLKERGTKINSTVSTLMMKTSSKVQS